MSSSRSAPPTEYSIDRATLNAQLLSSGEFHRLSKHIQMLLDESGWSENLAKECKDLLKSGEVKTFAELFERVKEKALRDIKESVVVEGVREVKETLEKFVERVDD